MNRSANGRPSKVLIADDHPLTREGLVSRLKGIDCYEVIGEAGDGKAALHLALTLDPDILLLDIEMPKMSGVEVARELSKKAPQINILALSAFDKKEYVYGVLDSGARGYLKKEEASQQVLSEALDAIASSDEKWISPSMATHLVKSMIEDRRTFEIIDSLTHRERQVLELIAAGKNNAYIGETLFISTHTVKNHIDHIRQKVGIRSRNELIAWSWEKGIVKA